MLRFLSIQFLSATTWLRCALDKGWQLLFALLTGVLALMQPIIPMFILCVGFIFFDTWSACDLQRRLHKLNPDHNDKRLGKFRSDRFGDTIKTLLFLFVGMVLARATDSMILRSEEDIAVRILTGAFCGWQCWSVLENLSSGNGAKWAKMLQKIMVDKVERYTGVSFDEFLKSDQKSEDA